MSSTTDTHRVPFLLYASRRKDHFLRRRAAVAVTLTLGITGCMWTYLHVRDRMSRLESDPAIGPVDWSAVLGSRTLLGAAWRLSGDPSAKEGINVLGMKTGSIEIAAQRSLRYRDGCVQMPVRICNTSDEELIIPPLRARGRVEARRGIPAFVQLVPSGILSKGVRTLSPADVATIVWELPAQPKPASAHAYVLTCAESYWIRIDAKGSRGKNCDSWNEVREVSSGKHTRMDLLREVQDLGQRSKACVLRKR